MEKEWSDKQKSDPVKIATTITTTVSAPEMTTGQHERCPFCRSDSVGFRFDGASRGYVICLPCGAQGPGVTRFMRGPTVVTDDDLRKRAWELWDKRS